VVVVVVVDAEVSAGMLIIASSRSSEAQPIDEIVIPKRQQ
jgi:hypothetical protein